jgi:hypothetical protein
MGLKEFVQEGFSKGKITVIVSLDVEEAFNSVCMGTKRTKKLTRKRLSTQLI